MLIVCDTCFVGVGVGVFMPPAGVVIDAPLDVVGATEDVPKLKLKVTSNLLLHFSKQKSDSIKYRIKKMAY